MFIRESSNRIHMRKYLLFAWKQVCFMNKTYISIQVVQSTTEKARAIPTSFSQYVHNSLEATDSRYRTNVDVVLPPTIATSW